MRPVNHEITLLAWAADDETGCVSILDIVETSHHFASHFTRKWMRMPEVTAISAFRPGQERVDTPRREIRRAA